MGIRPGRKLFRAPGATVKPASAPRLKSYTPVKTWSTPRPSRSAAPPPEPSFEEKLVAARDSLFERSRVLLAFGRAHSEWRKGAYFSGVVIRGAIADGKAGCLKGPSFADEMDKYHDIQDLTGLEMDIYEAIRDGAAAAFDRWRENVTVPLLPWYPMFTAFPGSEAPPTPSVPTPLSALLSAHADALLAPHIRVQIDVRLRPELRHPILESLLLHLTTSMSAQLGMWLATQTVSGVMGRGPVPTYAPPYVPVGPVLGGSVVAKPGMKI